RINAIEQRHKALELFLQDYVTNVDFLYSNDVNSRFYEYSKIKNDEILKD
ncbi:376_t:CDS:1, partial [Scutellospora calospora]